MKPFNNSQLSALTSSPLRIEEGHNYLIENDELLPYQHQKILGYGQSGHVEKVQDTITGRVFARKVIRVSGLRSKDRNKRRQLFENEMKIIHNLASHHHIIRIFATYITNRELGLILFPAADGGDLEDFLQDVGEDLVDRESSGLSDSQKFKYAVLRHAFGCLASGLDFMHLQRIRHKDIKPRNILVHEGQIVYTDFGYSLDSNGQSRSTTTGNPDCWTLRYCAPEVKDYEARNSKSDVFSLGCVFLEILSVLTSTVKVDEDRHFHEMIEEIHEEISHGAGSVVVERIKQLAILMTSRDPFKRPKAKSASHKLCLDQDLCCSHCLSTKKGILTNGHDISKSKPAWQNDVTDPEHSFLTPKQSRNDGSSASQSGYPKLWDGVSISRDFDTADIDKDSLSEIQALPSHYEPEEDVVREIPPW